MLSPSLSFANTQIRDICIRNGIKSLMHFTRTDNLSSILSNGLLSRNELARRKLPVVVNDKLRLDRQMDAICLSISFPNYQMFYRYRRSIKSTWVVLELDPQIIWNNDCAFCLTNAATTAMRNIPLAQRKRPEVLKNLFDDYVDNADIITRNNLFLPRNYPTNPQAEVLAFKPILPHQIQAIYVERRSEAFILHDEITSNEYRKLLSVNSFYFHPRDDFGTWQALR